MSIFQHIQYFNGWILFVPRSTSKGCMAPGLNPGSSHVGLGDPSETKLGYL